MAANGETYPKQIVNYRLITEIDAGGSGTVYLAEHMILTERQVAIKLLHTHLNASEDRKRFLDEAKVLHKLKHPHILPFHDVGFFEQRPYLITDYADGGSLRDRLQQPLPWDQVLVILQQIGEALQYAHDQGIVHRDLKPENILFRSDGHALLADFGIAREASMQRDTEVVGSIDYMAPEQFQKVICKEIDQYALACIAYEFISGHVPFQASTLKELLQLHAVHKPASLVDLKPSLPRDIEQAIFKALAKDPKDRFPNVHDFIHTLSIVPANHLSLMTSPLSHGYEKTPLQWIQEGEKQLMNNHPKKAIDAFTQALALDHDNRIAWLGKGKAHYQLQHTKKATEAFDYILSVDSNHSEALLYKGHLLARQGSHKKALECYDKALSFDPHNATIYVARGKQLYGLNQFKEALQAYEYAASLKKNIVTADYSAALGEVYVALERYHDALQAYEKALTGNPQRILYRLSKAQVLLKLERYKEALSLYEKLLKTSYLSASDKNESLYGKAMAQYGLKQYAEALKTIDKCKTISEIGSLSFLKGLIFFELKNYQKAYDNFTTVLNFKKNDYASLYNIAVIFLNVSQYEDCLNSCTRILSVYEDDADTWCLKGNTLTKLQRYEEALHDYNQAIKLKSYDPKAFIGKAQCLVKLQRYEEALEVYERCLVLDPQRADLWREKGATYLQIERLIDAFHAYIKSFHLQQDKTIQSLLFKLILRMDSTCLEQVLSTLESLVKTYPHNSYVYRQKAQALTQLCKYEEALETAEIALTLDKNDIDAEHIKTFAKDMIQRRQALEKAKKATEDLSKLLSSFSDSLSDLSQSSQASFPLSQTANISSPHPSQSSQPSFSGNPPQEPVADTQSNGSSSTPPVSSSLSDQTSSPAQSQPQSTQVPPSHPPVNPDQVSASCSSEAAQASQEKNTWWNRLVKKFMS